MAKKKKSASEIREELRSLASPNAPQKPPFDIRKALLRVGGVLAVVWVMAVSLASWKRASWPIIVVSVLTAGVAGAAIWAMRYVRRSEALGTLLKGADTEEGRKAALNRLETEFKKDDVQAALARAQLEMQEDPRKALTTLEKVDLRKQLGPVAEQVRAMRAMLHLTLGETQEARSLVDALELGKQQEPKTRAMFATVAGEAWGRTGQGKKAVETLELFNPEDPAFTELRVQMWRARAFAYAGANDMKAAARALKKLADINVQLLAMFVGQRKIHPLLEREAKTLLMKSGTVPRKMVRQRV